MGKSPGTPVGEAKRRSLKDLMKEKQDQEGSKTPFSAKLEQKGGDQGEGGVQEGVKQKGNQGEGTEMVVYEQRVSQWIKQNREDEMQIDNLQERQTWKGKGKVT